MSPQRPGWYVICDAYQRGPFKTEAEAERQLAAIERLDACPHDHQIKEEK